MKNPQTTIALPFLTHNISAIGGVQVTYRPIFHFSIFGIATYSCKYVFCSNNKSSVNLVVFPGLLIPKEVKTTYGDICKTISAFLVLPHKYFPPSSIYDKKNAMLKFL